jgi:hypothetical protein
MLFTGRQDSQLMSVNRRLHCQACVPYCCQGKMTFPAMKASKASSTGPAGGAPQLVQLQLEVLKGTYVASDLIDGGEADTGSFCAREAYSQASVSCLDLQTG